MTEAERLANQKTKWSSADCMDAATNTRRILIVADQLLDKLLDHNLQFSQQTGAAQIVDDLMTDLRRLAAVERELEALKASLAAAPPAQQASEVQQEPVAWKHDCAVLLTNGVELWIDACPHCGKPRTHPAKQAKPLTDEQGLALAMGLGWEVEFDGIGKDALELIRAVEAAHGIKE